MVKRKHTISGTLKGKCSFSKSQKKCETAGEHTQHLIEAPIPLRVYNLSEVPSSQVEESLQAAISMESSSSDFNSHATLEPVVEKATTTPSKRKESMTSQYIPSWYPKRDLSKVEIPLKYQFFKKSSCIRDRVGATARDPNYVLEIVAFFDNEKVKEA